MQNGATSNVIRLAVIGAIAFTTARVAQSQTTKTPVKKPASNRSAAFHTPWGDPDLQGVYSGDDFKGVPFERPVALGQNEFLTNEEYAKRVQDLGKQIQEDQAPTVTNRKTADLGQGNLQYWVDRGKPQRQTSLVVDPPDGRIPYREGKRPSTEPGGGGSKRGTPINSPEDLTLLERCIVGALVAVPSGEPGALRLLQAPGVVAITSEVIHETRIIPLDGRPHASPEIRQYLGDYRGHWDGETLVVDTSNFNGKKQIQGSGPDMRLTERFTRTGPDTLRYEFTVDDPATYTRPWTARLELTPRSQLLEYACHEGNYSVANMLSGSRADEKRAADKAKQGRNSEQ
jgi:hypothetical protein